MEQAHIEPEVGLLAPHIEAEVRRILGPVSLQTDFRRDTNAFSDVTVLIKHPVDNRRAADIKSSLEASEAVESVLFKKQKLSIRLSDVLIESIERRYLSKSAECKSIIGRSFKGQRIAVDFCDPNANKALHIGHLRNVAIGGAIAALWRALGATVQRQSVICDIGRNVAEALAGLEAVGADAALSSSEPLGPRLGQLYADYVASGVTGSGARAEADAPIERELARYDDRADVLLDRWRFGDRQTRDLWQVTTDRIIAEQAATLSRLGISFERLVRESEAVSGSLALAALLVSMGLAFIDEGGAYVLQTGRIDYQLCPLTRTDGFPTEHLRALFLLDGLRDDLAGFDAIIHVMGQEWRTSTEIRIDTLEALRSTGFPARYHMLPHKMVRFGGSDMKSSKGDVILIDELLGLVEDVLQEQGWHSGISEWETMVRASMLGPMLGADPEDTIDITIQDFIDPSRNPGLRIAQVMLDLRGEEWHSGQSPERRYLALQIERLGRMVETAALKAEPNLILKQIMRMVDFRLSGKFSTHTDPLLKKLIVDGLYALGWSEVAAGRSLPAAGPGHL